MADLNNLHKVFYELCRKLWQDMLDGKPPREENLYDDTSKRAEQPAGKI